MSINEKKNEKDQTFWFLQCYISYPSFLLNSNIINIFQYIIK